MTEFVTKQDLSALGKEVKHEMQKLEYKITIKLGALMTFLMIAIPALQKLL